jgi:hypothetical protein
MIPNLVQHLTTMDDGMLRILHLLLQLRVVAAARSSSCSTLPGDAAAGIHHGALVDAVLEKMGNETLDESPARAVVALLMLQMLAVFVGERQEQEVWGLQRWHRPPELP